MKFYVADAGDSLRTIAAKNGIDLAKLISLNPHIANTDLNIAGGQVRLPSSSGPGEVPMCPPPEPTDYLIDWIPLTPLERMAETEYDAVIVGTGAGGAAVLWRLCEQWGANGKRIGVVEAGDLLLPTHTWNIPTFNGERAGRFIENPKLWNRFGRFLPEYSGAKTFLALGGRTVHWGALSPRMHASALAGWPVTPQEMELYYNIAERAMNVTQDYAKDSSITEILLDRLRNNGFPEAVYAPLAADLESTRYGEIRSNVIFSSMIFLGRALNRRPFDLAVKARAVQVIAENGRAAGVRVMTTAKQSYLLKAKTVVLAANAYETPRLLLNSGIQGHAIGRYLTNHSFITARGTVSTRSFPEVLGTLGILIPQTEQRPYQLQFGGPAGYYFYHNEEKPAREEWDIGFYGAFGTVESRFENRLDLDPWRRDEYGVPELRIQFSYSERDRAIIRQTASAMRQAASAAGIRLISPGGLPDLCLHPPGDDNHESGTCRMGDDPSTSAADRYGQIHGISGLYAADNSVLPSLGAANPTLTTVALAIRTADRIIRT
ncbi:MAG TPA: GMC oxidoreductase [Paenibacillus sp.]|uniref:GMC oxidoreductase n=1 Tax=Paenibacillus sp. TaxID=58172 RepID=UPI002CCFD3FD|nr:GMC oxidoreductase [Paenibacillus sp.]HUC94200.1 GMC oxidoreductase [Paenibacillus sp.]